MKMKRLWPEEDDFFMIILFLTVFFVFCVSMLLAWE